MSETKGLFIVIVRLFEPPSLDKIPLVLNKNVVEHIDKKNDDRLRCHRGRHIQSHINF